MTHVLLSWLGVDTSQLPTDAHLAWTFATAPRSWMAFVYLAVVGGLGYGVLRLYRRDAQSLPALARRLLVSLRLATLSLLAVILLTPALALTQQRTLEPQIVVLVDNSQSMGVADRYEDDNLAGRVAAAADVTVDALRAAPPTRLQLVQRVLARGDGQLIRDWRNRGQLKWFAFAHRLKPLGDDAGKGSGAAQGLDPDAQASSLDAHQPVTLDSDPDGRAAPAELAGLEPLGHGTLLAQAVRESLRAAGTAPVAGLILISDGQNTAPRDAPLAAAAAAAAQQVPLFTVGVGDPEPPRNLHLANLFAEEQVWRNDPFEIQAQVIGQGFSGVQVELELLEQLQSNAESEDDRSEAPPEPAGRGISDRTDGSRGADASDQPGRVVARQTVTLPTDERPVPVVFRHQAAGAGQFVFTVRALPLQGEWTTSDNSQSALVRVLKNQLRVLLISGEASWDYRFLTGLLTRDSTVDLSCWLQSLDREMPQEGDTVLAHLPRTLDELGQFDVILLLDPDPNDFDDAWIGALRDYVSERSGGLLLAAGPKYAPRWLSDAPARGVRDLMPVVFDTAEVAEVESVTARNQQEWPLVVASAAGDHPLLRFTTDSAENQQIWRRMPGVFWSYPAAEAKPGSRVLLEHSDPALRTSRGARPLLVVGQYGAGRTAYLGWNGTWRWRRLGRNAEYFSRFWVQTCRYLVEGKLLASRRRGTLDASATKYQLGETALLTARLFDAAFEPLRHARLMGRAQTSAGERAFELTALPNQPGQYEGALPLDWPGEWDLSLELPGEGATAPVQVSRRIRVEPPRAEFADTRLDRAVLSELAEVSGGRYFDLDQLGALAAALPSRHRTLRVAGEPVPIWDTGRMAGLLIGLLSLEWAVRKRFQLL